jgi:hypothetical protein
MSVLVIAACASQLLLLFCTPLATGDSYKAIPTEVVPTVVLPPSPPTSAAKTESQADSTKAAESAPAAAQKAASPAAAAEPQATKDKAAEASISDYGFSKTLAPVAVEEYTGKYRWVYGKGV